MFRFFFLYVFALSCVFTQLSLADPADTGSAPAEEGFPVVPEHEDTLVNSVASSTQSTEPTGFFPTSADLALLGDSDYPRRGSGGAAGPDQRLQNAMGLFPYESTAESFYTRNAEVFAPINRTLGLFTAQKAFTGEFAAVPLSGYTVDSNLGFLTRTMQPERAHLRVGPLAFDLLFVEAGALWSDYNGPITFADGQEDGFLSYLSLGLRSTAQLTDSLFFSFASELVYLPGTNELAFRNGLGSRPSAVAEIFYQKRIGRWDLLLFDRFLGRPGVDLYADWDEPGVDRAGRYQFGFYEREGRTELFETNSAIFTNQIGFRASSMVGSSDWRFISALDHSDFWRTFGFEDHRYRDSLSLSMGYEGNNIPFAPLFSYRAVSSDRFDSFLNQASLQLRGRLTENIALTGMGGLFWTEGFENDRIRGAWRTAITHQFSQRGSHAFSVGQQLVEDPFSPEILFTTYYRYNIRYQLAQRLNASAFAQYSTGDRLVSGDPQVPTGNFENFLTGMNLSFHPFDFTRLMGSIVYSQSDNGAINVRERMIYRLALNQKLASRLNFRALYQYQDVWGGSVFNEHLVSGSLIWHF